MGAGLGDRNKGDLGGERLRKLKTRGDRLGCQLRAVGCDQNLLEHDHSPAEASSSDRMHGTVSIGQAPARPAFHQADPVRGEAG